MLFILKYFFMGALITLLGGITIAVIMLILNNIDTRALLYLGVFIIISSMVGFLTFRAFEKPDGYKFKISYDNVIYYTNDITVSNGAITFIDENGNENTIESEYTLKKIK